MKCLFFHKKLDTTAASQILQTQFIFRTNNTPHICTKSEKNQFSITRLQDGICVKVCVVYRSPVRSLKRFIATHFSSLRVLLSKFLPASARQIVWHFLCENLDSTNIKARDCVEQGLCLAFYLSYFCCFYDYVRSNN